MRLLLPVLFLTVAAGGIGLSDAAQGGCRGPSAWTTPSGRPAKLAPDFTLPPAADAHAKITLSEVSKEHPVLLIFWATWCPACVEEIPLLNEWQRKWESRGLRILSVNVEEPRGRVLQFSRRQKIDYPILLDTDGKVADRFGLVGVPVSILLAKGGKIIYYGYSLPDLERTLAQGE